MMRIATTVALVPGSENGIGPEVLLRALFDEPADESVNYIWCGDRPSLEQAGLYADIAVTFTSERLAHVGDHVISFMATCTGSLLQRAAAFLQHSVDLARESQVNAVVTAPIEKAALAFLDDGDHVGQTEFFARHLGCDGERPFMAFMGGPFFLSLLTTHVPLTKVASRLSEAFITDHIIAVANHSAQLTNKARGDVRLVVLGLNPHAGEHGLLGHEEEAIFRPAIASAQAAGISVEGPLAADGFFGFFHSFSAGTMPDAVIASYHDQGLIPYKLLAHGGAVNVTFGLRIPRTSPAHGTAISLCGTRRACAQSTKSALKLAVKLARTTRAS